MRHIDEDRLETDLEYRFQYLSDFMGFDATDVDRIHAWPPHLGPRAAELVEQTYRKLLSFDATARHFVPRQSGYEGPTPEGVSHLSLDDPQIQFRREHLLRYILALLGRKYDGKMVQYLDMVGRMHTPAAGSRGIAVPLVQMNALLGALSDSLSELILELPLDAATRHGTLRSFLKLLWLQNDLINRHYMHPQPAGAING